MYYGRYSVGRTYFSILFTLLVCLPFLSSGEAIGNDESDENEDVCSENSELACAKAEVAITETPPFKDIVLVYERFNNLVSGMWGVRDYVILRFDDGTFSRDITGVMDNGIAKSKYSEPIQWGQWQGDDESLALKFHSNSFMRVIAAKVSDPIGNNYKLDKCYTGSKNTYQISGDVDGLDTKAAYNTFCFQKDGIFSHDSSTSNIDADYISSTKSDTAGFYEINGNVIRLRYGNDTVVRRFFAVFSDPDDPHFAISIGSAVFKP